MKKYMVDARGKQCPIPVVETKKMLAQMAESDIVETLVDNAIAVQNLEKMAKQKQLECSWEQQDEHTYRVFIKAEGAVDEAGEETAECIPCQPVSEKTGNTIVVLSSDCMGEGDEVLGRALMKGFIYALTSQEELPDTVIMYNRGATSGRRLRIPRRSEAFGIAGSGDFDLWNMSESLRTDGEAFCGKCYKYVCDL